MRHLTPVQTQVNGLVEYLTEVLYQESPPLSSYGKTMLMGR